MFSSRRSPFSSERGATTSWLAGITAAALLVGTVALPAMADESVPEEPIAEQPAPPVEEPVAPPVAEQPAPPVEEQAILSEEGVEDESESQGEEAEAPVASLAASSAATQSSTAGIVPDFVAGNPSCPAGLLEIRVDDKDDAGTNWTRTVDGVTVSYTPTEDEYLSWNATVGIDIVLVKGGPNANKYTYDPPAERTSDSNLSAPLNGDRPYGISHVSFCYDKPIQLEKLTVEKTATGTYDREYTWDITKTVDGKATATQEIAAGEEASFNYQVIAQQTGVEDSGWEVTGTITVTNPNNVAVPVSGLTDSIGSGWSCELDSSAPTSVAAKSSVPVDYTCMTSNKPGSYSGTNTATVSFPTEFEADGKEYAVPGGTASGTKDFALALDQTTNKTVDVADTLGGAEIDPSSLTGSDDPGKPALATYDYTLEFAGEAGTCTDYENTARITVGSGEAKETLAKDSATATVCVGADLTVGKTATGTYGRTYAWDIKKSVAGPTTRYVEADGETTFSYTVEAIPVSVSEAGWTVTGEITLTNPNDWLEIKADVSDAIDNGGICLVDGKASATVTVPMADEKGPGTKSVGYVCTYPDKPSKTVGVVNTATATWSSEYPTPGTSAKGEKTFDFSAPTETNRTITVVDDKTDPENPIVLGEVDFADGIVGQDSEEGSEEPRFTFTYDLTKPGVTGECVDHTNTAWIDLNGDEALGDEPDASTTVTVCPLSTITVIKTDADNGEPLEGATFRLWTDVDKSESLTEGDEPIGGSERITGADGKAVWDDLEPGYYLVEEVEAPTGYALSSPNPRSVIVGGEGAGEAAESVALAEVESSGSPSGHAPGSAAANQVAYWCPDGGTKIDGTKGREYTLTSDHPLVVVKAGAGQYANTLFTNAVAGQTVWADTNGNFTFDDGDKEISHIILCDGPTEPEPGDATLIFANPRLPGQITVVKVDDLGNPVKNITFELFRDLNGNNMQDETDEVIGQQSTTDSGTVTWAGLEWASDYWVREASWPGSLYEPAGPLMKGPFTISRTALTASVTFVNNRILGITATVDSFCDADAPYYRVNVKSQNPQFFSSKDVTVRWYQANEKGQPIDASGNPIALTGDLAIDQPKFVAAFDPDSPTKAPYVDTFELGADGNLVTANLLWKGAVQKDGKMVKWPGWVEDAPGVWRQVESGGVRPGMFAVVSVNPTTVTSAIYPPAASPCANPPGVLGLDKSSPTDGQEVQVPSEITYSVKLTNTGGQDVTDALVDTLPAGVTYIGGSATRDGKSAEPTVDGQKLVWANVKVGFDDPATTGANEGVTVFTYRVTVTAGAPAGSDLVNLATWSGLKDSTTHRTPPVGGTEEEVVEDEEEVVEGEEDVAEEEIAATGANVGPLVTTALLAMLAGGLMITFGRRRRNEG